MFFTAIHQMMTESVDLTIVIRKTNGQLTVSTLPKSNGLKDEAQNHIVPLTVRGTGGQGRRQQQGCQGSEIQGDEGRTRETGEV